MSPRSCMKTQIPMKRGHGYGAPRRGGGTSCIYPTGILAKRHIQTAVAKTIYAGPCDEALCSTVKVARLAQKHDLIPKSSRAARLHLSTAGSAFSKACGTVSQRSNLRARLPLGRLTLDTKATPQLNCGKPSSFGRRNAKIYLLPSSPTIKEPHAFLICFLSG